MIRHRIIVPLEARRQYIKKDQHTQDTWVLCDSVISSRYVFPGWQLLQSCLIELLAQTQVDKPVCHSDSVSSHQDATWLSKFQFLHSCAPNVRPGAERFCGAMSPRVLVCRPLIPLCEPLSQRLLEPTS